MEGGRARRSIRNSSTEATAHNGSYGAKGHNRTSGGRAHRPLDVRGAAHLIRVDQPLGRSRLAHEHAAHTVRPRVDPLAPRRDEVPARLAAEARRRTAEGVSASGGGGERLRVHTA